MIECVWLNGVTPVLLVLSCQIGCGDKCITDEDGVAVALVALVGAVIVMSLGDGGGVVVVYCCCCHCCVTICCRSIIIISSFFLCKGSSSNRHWGVELRITKLPVRKVNAIIIMMDTVADVLPDIIS